MGSIEDIGEAIIKVLNRVFYYMIGTLIWLVKVSRPLGERLKGVISSRGNIKIYQYFERRNIELKDYTVLKAQAVTLLFLISAVVFVFGYLDVYILALLALFSAYSLRAMLPQLKGQFTDDYPAYREFFLSYFAISALLIVVKQIKPTVNYAFPFFHLLLLSVGSVVVFSYIFKRKYGRNYTFGRVIKDGDLITVKVNYDLCSSVKPGTHTFENRANAKEGDVVKLLVESKGLNLGGSRIVGPIPVE